MQTHSMKNFLRKNCRFFYHIICFRENSHQSMQRLFFIHQLLSRVNIVHSIYIHYSLNYTYSYSPPPAHKIYSLLCFSRPEWLVLNGSGSFRIKTTNFPHTNKNCARVSCSKRIQNKNLLQRGYIVLVQVNIRYRQAESICDFLYFEQT
jgi:hypothetical protein